MMMDKLLVSRIRVKGLWGHRNFDIKFQNDINIIIGPNASGKTTLINILHHALTGNLGALSQIVFKSIDILLLSFDGTGDASVNVVQDDETLAFSFGESEVQTSLEAWRGTSEASRYVSNTLRRRTANEVGHLRMQLIQRVPAIWLPVSRRLPISDEEDADNRRLHRRPLESVDECLAELLEGLQKYRVSLDSQLSELRKEFQKHALETVLYDKQHDRAPDLHSFIPPTEDDRKQLYNAFVDLGLIDPRIRKRIDEHFAAALRASEKLKSETSDIDINTLFIIPLMNRTKSMVQFAQQLEKQRTDLFASLHSYEEIVSSFLVDKKVEVDSKGQLTIVADRKGDEHLEWRHLSSGEKQILILLTQAILRERDPVVYVADEPELSLHVTWQEKLISSLRALAGRCQFIVATHSPDIAGGFSDKIIDLGKQ
jgi:ABC-type hemin transport system ATPase subunit